MSPVRTSFESLPAELKLEIVRCFLIVQPPYIDRWGRLRHALLDKKLDSIRDLVLDLIFHSTAITVSGQFIRRSLGRTYIPLYGVNEFLEMPRFLKRHDRTHGQHKRNLIRLVVQDDFAPTAKFLDPVRLASEWKCWAEEIGLPWECVDVGQVVRRFLNPDKSKRLSCDLAYALVCLDKDIESKNCFTEAAVRLRYELLEFVRRGEGDLYCPQHQGVNQVGHCLCCPRYSRSWNVQWNGQWPTLDSIGCRCSQSNGMCWEAPYNGID